MKRAAHKPGYRMKTDRNKFSCLVLASWVLAIFLARSAWGQVLEQRLKSFGVTGKSGSNPMGLLVGADGALYGTTRSGGPNFAGTVFRVALDGTDYTVLYSFQTNGVDGHTPMTGVVQGHDGQLYGTTSAGGDHESGTVFKLARDGTGYRVLFSFTPDSSDGNSTASKLVSGTDGALYGTTTQGGSEKRGTIFKLNADGTAYQIVHHFGSIPGDGSTPVALVQGADGTLYGATKEGGAFDSGTVFTLGTDGGDYEVLYDFGRVTGDGAMPGALVAGADRDLFGTTLSSGNHHGTVFRLRTDGSGYLQLHEFTGTLGDGATPEVGLIQGADGALYGTTLRGGSRQDAGTVYRVNTDGTGYRVLRRFSVISSVVFLFSSDGQQPGPLVQGATGKLYGITTYGGTTGQGGEDSTGAGTLFELRTDGDDYVVNYNFSETGGDGAKPPTGLILGRDGMFYGTTVSGGLGGHGTVFRLARSGAGYEIVHSFGLNPIDGLIPNAGLSQGSDGVLYGTTTQGGYIGGNGAGILFKVNPDGSGYTHLHSFGFGVPNDGDSSQSPPLLGRDGELYGTLPGGGYESPWGGFGTVYKLNTRGTVYSTLHLFSTNSLEGQSPQGGLVQGGDGALYGTTFGGVRLGGFGVTFGTVFKLLTDGTGFQVLHTFTNNGVDGVKPSAALVQGIDGAFYGTTQSGGSNNASSGGSGTVFKLNPDGSGYQVLHHFGSSPGDGVGPTASLSQGTDQALYGTTLHGGSFADGGTAFKLNPDGTGYTQLYRFGFDRATGHSPQGGLIQGADGAFYGSTLFGGDLNVGTIFRLGPTPFQFTSFSRLLTDIFSVSISGSPNTACRLEASTDLVNWVTLTNRLNATGTLQFFDQNSASFLRRYYRGFQTP